MSYKKTEDKYFSIPSDNPNGVYHYDESSDEPISLYDYWYINSWSTTPQKVINFFLKTAASSAIGAFLALALACIAIVGILAFAANPVTVALLPLLPIIFVTVAWAGAGIGGGIGAFVNAIKQILMEKVEGEGTKVSTVGWFGIGVGLMGTFATTGALVGTFIPVPVLGTLVGAASGAVMGVIVGAAAWLLSGIITAIVTSYQNKNPGYDRDGYFDEHDADNTYDVGYTDEPTNGNYFSNPQPQPQYSNSSNFFNTGTYGNNRANNKGNNVEEDSYRYNQ